MYVKYPPAQLSHLDTQRQLRRTRLANDLCSQYLDEPAERRALPRRTQYRRHVAGGGRRTVMGPTDL